MRRVLPALLVLSALAACDQQSTPPGGRCDNARCTGTDVCDPATGRCGPRDAGTPSDGGADAGFPDGGLPDGGADGGATDAGATDGGATDGGATDGGADGGLPDAGVDAGCGDDFDCAGTTPACRTLTRECVGCVNDSYCFGSTGRCNPTSFTCVDCVNDTHCVSAAPRCDPVRNLCFGCLSNADCANPTPVCAGTFDCQPCNTSAECGPGRACDVLGRCNALPDSCANPQGLNLLDGGLGTVSFSAEPGAAIDDYQGTCNVTGGPELVYSFTTAGPRDLSVSVAPLTGSAAQPVVFLRGVNACPGTVEQSCDAPANGAASLAVAGLPAGTWYLFVESRSGAPGRVSVNVSLQAPAVPPTNDTCSAPQALAFTGTTAVVVGTTILGVNDAQGDPSCSATARTSGKDLVYSYTTTARSNVTVTVRAVIGSPLHPVVAVRSACATAGTELGCAASLLGEARSVTLNGQLAGTYFVWVDSADSTQGAFQLEVTATPTVDNDTCAAPQGLSVVGQTATALGDTSFAANGNLGSDPTPSCSVSAKGSGRDVVYSYTLTTPRDVTVSVTPTGASPTFQPVLYVRNSACTATATVNELACVSPLAPTVARASFLAQGVGTYFVWVDGAQDTAGPFQLEVTTASPTPPPANDTCATPQLLSFTSGVASVTATTALAANDNSAGDVSPTCSTAAKQSGKDVVYAFDVTAPRDAAIVVTPTAGSTLRPVLYVRKTSCTSQLLGDELVCLERLGEARTTLTNLAAGRYYVWVDGTAGTSGGFTLSVTLSGPTPPPANDNCPGAPLVFAGNTATVTGTTVGATNSNATIDLAPTCGPEFYPRKFGRDLVYQVTLTAPQDLDIRVAPASGSAVVPAVYVRAPGQCTSFSPGYELGCMSAPSATSVNLYLPNLAAGTYFLFVDSSTPDAGGFVLEVTRRAPTLPPANDSCSASASVPTGATGVLGDSTGARDDYSDTSIPQYASACRTQFFSGRDVVYQYTATATGTVTATVTPTGSFDPALLLLQPSCGAGSCVRAADGAGPGGAEALTFSVTQGQTYFLVVDSYDSTMPYTFGAFRVTVQ